MTFARAAFGAFFIVAGTLHFTMPGYFAAIVPPWLPAPTLLVALSGVAEILGGIGFLLARWRAAAGVGLMLLLIAVFPANIEMLRQARANGSSSSFQAALWLRLPLQAVLIWLAWRLSRRDRTGS
ncbi:MAG: DoxX family membrane protein [Acidobacteriota bacterium]|nr:DoxX family membrane protein [Acidobacteriota bacterium]